MPLRPQPLLLIALLSLLPLATPAALAAETEPAKPSLVVTGKGTVDIAPDRAVLSFGVVAESEEAAAAQEQVNDVMADAIKAVRKLDIPDKHIQTTNLSMHPVYDHRKTTGRKISGYRASYTLQVTLDEINQSGAIIDAALTAGANTFQGIRFTLRNDAAAREGALRKAASDARGKAKAIAEAMGVKLVRVTEIREGSSLSVPMPRPYAARGMAEAATAAPVQPGELTVHASMTVRYEIAE